MLIKIKTCALARILHPTNLACLGPLAHKRRFHRTSWRLPPSTHDATFSHITTAHEAREAGEAPSALTVYCITRVGVGANIQLFSMSAPPDRFIRWSVESIVMIDSSPAQEVDTWEVSTLIVFRRRERQGGGVIGRSLSVCVGCPCPPPHLLLQYTCRAISSFG